MELNELYPPQRYFDTIDETIENIKKAHSNLTLAQIEKLKDIWKQELIAIYPNGNCGIVLPLDDDERDGDQADTNGTSLKFGKDDAPGIHIENSHASLEHTKSVQNVDDDDENEDDDGDLISVKSDGKIVGNLQNPFLNIVQGEDILDESDIDSDEDKKKVFEKKKGIELEIGSDDDITDNDDGMIASGSNSNDEPDAIIYGELVHKEHKRDGWKMIVKNGVIVDKTGREIPFHKTNAYFKW